MKCKYCHTALPDFGRFQKKVCPNCGNSVSAVSQNIVAPTAPKPEIILEKDLFHRALAANRWLDRTCLTLIFSQVFTCLLLFFVNFCPDIADAIAVPLVLAMIVTSMVFEFCLIDAIIQRIILNRQLQYLPNPKTERAKLGIASFWQLFKTIMLGAGLIFFFLLTCFGVTSQIHYAQGTEDYALVDATISRINEEQDSDGTTHTVFVSYTYEGKEYKNIHHPHYKSSMEEGDPLTVHIQKENPGEIADNPVWLVVTGALPTAIFICLIWRIVVVPIINRKKNRIA